MYLFDRIFCIRRRRVIVYYDDDDVVAAFWLRLWMNECKNLQIKNTSICVMLLWWRVYPLWVIIINIHTNSMWDYYTYFQIHTTSILILFSKYHYIKRDYIFYFLINFQQSAWIDISNIYFVFKIFYQFSSI